MQMDEETRTELHATIEARKELGPAHERELVEGFLAKIEHEIDRRVDERVAKLKPRKGGRRMSEAELGIFVPIFIFAGVFGHALGIVAAAIALAAVFLGQLFLDR
jgi:hypothetical protein